MAYGGHDRADLVSVLAAMVTLRNWERKVRGTGHSGQLLTLC
jgi:hypothetical protein